ncbi:hypothetical protein [Demequina sp. NBRC 110053]|uniref:hypothetical protein n=1 Tax=Demequina sp. NBRC 110053 TaxID=1570342 RepID=UPI0009FE70B0|nr:hypothetical protein [Demequina sp. NBRC 110053]
MTDLSAGDSAATNSEAEHRVTLEDVLERLERIKQIQEFDRRVAAAACAQATAPRDRNVAEPRTAVIFSDEPCGTCGEVHVPA